LRVCKVGNTIFSTRKFLLGKFPNAYLRPCPFRISPPHLFIFPEKNFGISAKNLFLSRIAGLNFFQAK